MHMLDDAVYLLFGSRKAQCQCDDRLGPIELITRYIRCELIGSRQEPGDHASWRENASRVCFWLGYALKAYYLPLDIDPEHKERDPQEYASQMLNLKAERVHRSQHETSSDPAQDCRLRTDLVSITRESSEKAAPTKELLLDWVKYGDCLEDWCTTPCNNVRQAVVDIFAATEPASDQLSEIQCKALARLRQALSNGGDMRLKSIAIEVNEGELNSQEMDESPSALLAREMLLPISIAHEAVEAVCDMITLAADLLGGECLQQLASEQQRITRKLKQWVDLSFTGRILLASSKPCMSSRALVAQTLAARYACLTASLLWDVYLLVAGSESTSCGWHCVMRSYVYFLSKTRMYSPFLPQGLAGLKEITLKESALQSLNAIVEQLARPEQDPLTHVYLCLWIDVWIRKLPSLRRLIMTDASLRECERSVARQLETRCAALESKDEAKNALTEHVEMESSAATAHHTLILQLAGIIVNAPQSESPVPLEVPRCFLSFERNYLALMKANSTKMHPFTQLAYGFLFYIYQLTTDGLLPYSTSWPLRVLAERLCAHDGFVSGFFEVVLKRNVTVFDDFKLHLARSSVPSMVQFINEFQSKLLLKQPGEANVNPTEDMYRHAIKALTNLSGCEAVLDDNSSVCEHHQRRPLLCDVDALYRLAMLEWQLPSNPAERSAIPPLTSVKVMLWAAVLGQPYAQLEMGNLWHSIYRRAVMDGHSDVAEHAQTQTIYWYACGATSPCDVADHSLSQLEIILKETIQ